MYKKISLSLIILFSLNFILSAQNISTVDVKSLSETQIQQIITEMQNNSLTIDQAVVLAESRGATPTQINDLRRRIQDLQSGKQQSLVSPGAESTQSSTIVREAFSEKAETRATEKNKRVFGFHLFNNENLTFEPSVNIPTPKNYVIGSGDEIYINVWGASQQSYQLLVDQNGAIQVIDLGPIYLSGMNFEKAKTLIKKRLTAIYAGMSGNNPNTWAEVSLGSLRAIKINIIGEVNVPGTYNLPSTATTFNALYLSGGPNENGSFRNIKLIREGKTTDVIDVYDFLINGNTDHNVQLRDQDIIFIPTYKKRVEVSGTFKRNGFFELIGGEYLSDLIRYAGGFSESAYQKQISITKYTDQERMIADIQKVEFSSYMPDNGDVITAKGIVDRFINRVSISGAIYHPGDYELEANLTLSQLIMKAEGVKEEVYSERGIIIREKDNKETEIIDFNVGEVISGHIDYELKKEDKVQISDLFSMQEEQYINVMGEVQSPGRLPYHEQMTLGDALFLAKGLKISADTTYVEISRRLTFKEMAVVSDRLTHIFTLSIPRDLNTNIKELGFELEAYDNINIRRSPNYELQGSVQIIGEVVYGGAFSLRNKQMRISDLVKLSGSLTPYAYINGASFTRNTQELGSEKITIELSEIISKPGSSADLLLMNGDVLNIPRKLQTVKVNGAIQNPLSITYEVGRTLKYYINQSGGFQTEALKRKIYVKYPNGRTVATNSFIFKNYPKIEPGSEIIVPTKPEKIRQDNSGKWMAWSSVMASLTIAFATIFK